MAFPNFLVKPITNYSQRFIKKVLPSGIAIFNELMAAADDVSFKYRVTDAWAVLRSSGLYLVFAAFAMLTFWLLPQGRDVMYMLVDKWTASVGRFLIYLIFLLAAQILWSIATEFGSRYAIYVSDNSGKSLSPDRVRYRKAVQKAIAAIYLLLPTIILLIALIIVCAPPMIAGNYKLLWPAGIAFLAIYLTGTILSGRYFQRKQGRFWLLPFREHMYVSKLFGIYKDYTYALPDQENFKGLAAVNYTLFTHVFTKVKQTEDTNFPQSDNLHMQARVPVESTYRTRKGKIRKRAGFRLLPVGFRKAINPTHQEYKWNYHIPLAFYPKLHYQVRWIALFSLGIYLIVTFLGGWPLLHYSTIGAPALLCLAFACWSGMYVGILFMDFGVLRHKWFSVRLCLVSLFVFSSFAHDHPVRHEAGRASLPSRISLQEHFDRWIKNYKDSLFTRAYYKKSVRANITGKDTLFYPIVFVCAEGGALRTGAYTSMLLSYMQDTLLLMKDSTPDLRQSVYAYSTVSGGTLGVGFFNAITNVNRPGELKPLSYRDMTLTFFEKDFLSPVIGRMLYGDVINSFIPCHIPFFDRAIGLELAWEAAYNGVTAGSQYNVFSNSFHKVFNSLADTTRNYPALFFNTTEVEDGLQCWITNVDAAGSGLPAGKSRDLYAAKLRSDINYSTAINFSTRFPLFSPSGAVYMDDKSGFHYVDGGYVENTGAATMLDILRGLESRLTPYILQDSIHYPRLRFPVVVQLKPYVIMFRYGESSIDNGVIRYQLRSMLTDILTGIYKTRVGRSQIAVDQLKDYVQNTLHGEFINMPLRTTSDDVPLNWALSNKSLKALDSIVNGQWKTDTALLKIYFRDASCQKCTKEVLGWGEPVRGKQSGRPSQ